MIVARGRYRVYRSVRSENPTQIAALNIKSVEIPVVRPKLNGILEDCRRIECRRVFIIIL